MKIFIAKSVIIILALLVGGCATAAVTENNAQITEGGAPATPTPASTVEESVLLAVHTKTDGWEVPRARKKQVGSGSKFTWKTENGTPVEVTAISYKPVGDLLTGELAEAWGERWGSIAIDRITGLRVNNNTFCFIVSAGKALPNSTGKMVQGGPVFPYRYFDQDGDGKFETLGALKAVPDWVLDKH